MYIRLFLLCILSVILLSSSCDRGAETLPVLSNNVFTALQSSSPKRFEALIPSEENIETFYKLYEARYYDDDELDTAIADAINVKLPKLREEFLDVLATAGDENLQLEKS